MGPVARTALPATSALNALVLAGDFVDCYAVESTLGLDEAAARAMDFPARVRVLLALRNLLVAPLGLRVRPPAGKRLGPFPLRSRGEAEIVAGFDDRHLDFRVAIIRDGPRLHAATWVRTHNAFGRAYLRAVLPFHRRIMRGAAARMAG